MSSRPARSLSPRTSQEHCLKSNKEHLRRSERLQRLSDSNRAQPAPKAFCHKLGPYAAVATEQQTKRARQATDSPPTAPKSLPSEDLAIDSFPPFSGRKRRHEETLSELEPDKTTQKRSRSASIEFIPREALGVEAEDDTEDNWRDIVSFWVREGRWPRRYFQPCFDMDHLVPRKKSSLSSRKRSSSASSVTPSDQRPREEKSGDYNDARYETLLATKDAFMVESPASITDASKDLCNTLLQKEQDTPRESLFRDDIFKATCRKMQNRNETRVIRDVALLIIPSAEHLATFGATELECLIESTNEGWNNSIPLTKTRPQPDYSVGFRREAFSVDQLAKLAPFIGNWLDGDQSMFMATYYMFFPFLAGEAKGSAAALEVADRQNAHSMVIAARAVFELFRLVGREAEVDRQILSFSISHNDREVHIYGYYPVIEETGTKYYRHPIHLFHFTTLDGKEKWTSYRFTKNVYEHWMPSHFARICGAINQIPSDIDFSVDSLPDPEPRLITPQSSLGGAAASKRPKMA